jgi:hypothetical protein
VLDSARHELRLTGAKDVRREESLMKSMLRLVAMTMTTSVGAVILRTESATGDAQTPSRFELAQADRPRGPGVEGWIHNGFSWRITNVGCALITCSSIHQRLGRDARGPGHYGYRVRVEDIAGRRSNVLRVALVGIAAFVFNVTGLFIPGRYGY